MTYFCFLWPECLYYFWSMSYRVHCVNVIEPSTEETVADTLRSENSTDKQQKLPSAEHGSSSGVSTVGHSSKGNCFFSSFFVKQTFVKLILDATMWREVDITPTWSIIKEYLDIVNEENCFLKLVVCTDFSFCNLKHSCNNKWPTFVFYDQNVCSAFEVCLIRYIVCMS